MDEQRKTRIEKLESHLNQACDAEALGNRPEAERQFRRALFYEAKLRSDVAQAKDYVATTGPVYPTGLAGTDGNSADKELEADINATPCKK